MHLFLMMCLDRQVVSSFSEIFNINFVECPFFIKQKPFSVRKYFCFFWSFILQLGLKEVIASLVHSSVLLWVGLKMNDHIKTEKTINVLKFSSLHILTFKIGRVENLIMAI